MIVVINDIIGLLKETMYSYPIFISMSLGVLLVFIESIIPALPLCAFVAINVILFGNITGILISYIGTLVGCITSYTFFKTVLGDYFYNKFKDNKKARNLIYKVNNLKFSTLVMLLTFPFTPAFSINIACGISKMDYKKFILACLIAKLPMIYFWGYVGTTLLESITNPYSLINITAILIISYLASKIFMNKFKIC